MVCPNCNSPLEDGAMFCANCGMKIEAGGAAGAGGPAVNAVFCPNCGKRLAAGDIFCDECGFNLSQGAGGAPGGKFKFLTEFKQKHPRLIYVIPACAAAALILAAGIFAAVMLGGSGGESHLVYFKDESMMLVDLRKGKPAPVELTDSYSKDYATRGVTYGNFISKDGKYVMYREDYDGDTYDLFLARVSKPKNGVKVDSKVSSSMILDNHNILYKKKDDLYLYNGKESVRLAKDVGIYRLDESQKNICWSERDRGENVYYLQDLAQKKEPVELEDDADEFYIDDELKDFYALKGDKLYHLDKEGNREKIADDIEQLSSYDPELGLFCYTKAEEQEIPYADLVYGTADASEGDQERLKEQTYQWEARALYLFDGKEEQLITDRLAGTVTYTLDEKGQYFLFWEYPDMETVEVSWSDLENGSWSSCVENAVREERKLVLASAGQRIGEFEDVERCTEARLNVDSKKAYLLTTDEDGEDMVIWTTSLSGSGELEEYDDGDDLYLLFADSKGLYYLKDADGDGGDLYYNQKEIGRDVISVQMVGENGPTAVMSDYDDRDGACTISAWNGKKSVQVSEDVSFADVAEDGTYVLLVDYNHSRTEGELMYFNGRKLKTLDDDVSSFVRRRDSAVLRMN